MHTKTVLPHEAEALETYIADREKEAGPLKKDTHARIIWNDSARKNKTPCSIVYLHGFKGSQGEGHPVHQTVAETLGCNLYLARLHGHGLQREHYFANLDSRELVRSAEDAFRIGQKIGDKVILMGCSTGAALALAIAATRTYNHSIEALVLYSPLIHLYGIHSLLLENRVGRGLLRCIPGKNYRLQSDPFSPHEEAIWYPSYRLNGALVLGETVQKTMTPANFKKVQARTFIGYYYKDKRRHDRIVSTAAIKRMAKQLGTPAPNITLKNFPRAGSHVICSSLLSGAVQNVIDETTSFLIKNNNLSTAGN